MRGHLVVDIETTPLVDAEQYLTPLAPPAQPDLDAIQPAKNLVDPAKVAADIEKRKAAALTAYALEQQAHVAKWAAMIDQCALIPDLCRVVCLGWMSPADQRPVVKTCQTVLEEKDALEQFGREANGADLVTFNGLSFDLPVLMRRALYLRVPFPVWNIDRYRTNHIDLMAKLSFNGVLKPHGLRFYLARFGIQIDDLATGKDIAAMVREKDWMGIAAHCSADVLGTKQLAERIGAIPARVSEPEAMGAF